MSQQAVFLFDMNVFSEFKHESDIIMQKYVSFLRVVSLRLLTEFSNVSPNFRFGAKFFNQGNFTHEKDKHTLHDVSLKTFENLENKIIDRYTRYFAYMKKISQEGIKAIDKKSEFYEPLKPLDMPPVKKLNIALTETLCDYEWNSPDMCSPVRRKRNVSFVNMRKKFIFLFSSCPMNIMEYCGVDMPITSEDLSRLIMPPPLYKKFVVESGINLMWLDTSDTYSSLIQNNYKLAAVQEMEHAITKLGGALLPINLLVPAGIMLDLMNQRHNNIVDDCCKLYLPNDLVPFSELFVCYISAPCIKATFTPWNSQLVMNGNDPINLIVRTIRNTMLSDHNIVNSPFKLRKTNMQKCTLSLVQEIKWSIFSVHGVVTKEFYGVPDALLICQAVQHSTVSDGELTKFDSLLKNLLVENLSLVLKCESEDGAISIGLLFPLTALIGSIAIYNPVTFHISKARSESPFSSYATDSLKDKLKEFVSGVSQVPSKETIRNVEENGDAFQIASLEKWFVSSSRISETSKPYGKSCPNTSGFPGTLLKKLQQEYRQERKRKSPTQSSVASPFRRSSRLKRLHNETEQAPTSFNDSSQSSACVETLPVASQEKEVIDKLRQRYVSAIESSGSLLSSAQFIVNSIVQFLKPQGNPTLTKEGLFNFMDEHFLKSPKTIAEEFDGKTDAESVSKWTKEYEMQVLLNMEIEAVFPDAVASSICIASVIAQLRRMLFVVGHTEVSQFLCDCLKENYYDNLRYVLQEIEEELGVSITDSPLALSSPNFVISPDNTTRSSHGSVPSCRSSSSVSSQRENSSFRRTLSQISFSASTHNRQIMVPCELLRKPKDAKPKTSVLALRKSPRLAIKKVASPKPSAVRRNLFNSAKKSAKSPLTAASKMRKLTPKGRHILKVSYVPETPSPKQGKSSVRSRQAHLRRLSGNHSALSIEVAESPTLSGKKQARGDSKEMLKDCDTKKTPTLRRTASKDAPSTSTACYYPSPSTRERCSKRLFQNSPRVLRQ